MKGFKTFPFLIITVLSFAACTEEVAQELKKKQSSSSNSGDLSTSSIRLVHKMDSTLSFNMHKSGTMNGPCELTPSTSSGFDPQTYYTNPDDGAPNPAQVIDCVLEAQENDLFNHGAKYELQVDEQLCEYVTYTPFRYVEMQFGSTAKTVYQIECADDTCNSQCGKTYEYYDGSSGLAGLQGALSASDLTCKFDYSADDYGRNCDEGEIRTTTLYLDNEKVGDPAACPGTTALSVMETSTTDCMGDHLNCLGGPAIEQVDDIESTTLVYSNTELNQFTQEWEITSPIKRGNGNTNMYLANYSRICADNTVIKVDGFGDEDPATYIGMELEGHQTETELNDLQAPPSAQLYNDAYGELDYVGMAENPWRALVATSPYYSFKCLDKARDVKAQIRLFIREWDRSYTGPIESFTRVTDIYSPVPMMDSNQTHDGRDWNNIMDWDDFFDSNDVWIDNQCDASATPFDDTNATFPGEL